MTERREKLEASIKLREPKQADLLEQLNAQSITEEQVQDLMTFTFQVMGSLEKVESDDHLKRELIEALDLKVTLAVEANEEVIYSVLLEKVCARYLLPRMVHP